MSMSKPEKGTVCRFIEIGKEEKPIYKLVCDDYEELT